MDQTRQIERLRWNVKQVRQYVLKALGEIEDQLNEMAGPEPEGKGGDWKTAWKQYEAGKK